MSDEVPVDPPGAPPPRAATAEIRIAGRAILELRPADGRVRVGLVMPVVDRVVDVSVQPGSACAALEDAGRRAQVPASSIEREARRALVGAARSASAWEPGDGVCLSQAFGGVAFPLLAAAYDDGGSPLREVPRWAAPILSATTIGEGARVAFGPSATRPVRRALVAAIRPLRSGEVDLATLALALIGQDVLEPDRLARLLCGDRVAQTADLPDPATLRSAREVLGDWEPARAERVLLEAAACTDGVARLLDIVHYARQLGDHGPPHPLPSSLTELHDVHRALMRSAAAVPPRRDAPAADPAHRAPARRAPARPQRRPLPPPVPGRRLRPDTPLTVPARVLALDGSEVGDLTVVLPRTVGDLDRWGRMLSNCLGDFGHSAATGRSVVIGMLRANRLVYALELAQGGTIRQFSGTANRAPTAADRRSVVHALATAGVLDPRAPANRPWIAGSGGEAAVERAS